MAISVDENKLDWLRARFRKIYIYSRGAIPEDASEISMDCHLVSSGYDRLGVKSGKRNMT